MEYYLIEDIVKDVKVALDENKTSEALIAENDIDTLTLNEIIKSKIVDAAKTIILDAPHYMLDKGEPLEENIGWVSSIGYGQGNIILPEDFLRLVSFQMSDWSYPVTEPITDTHPAYAMQFSRFAGIKGNPQKPVVAIVRQQCDGLVLQFFSCTAGKDTFIKQASYIPMPKIETDSIELCQRLYPATVYYIAYLVLLSIKEGEAATIMINISKNLLR